MKYLLYVFIPVLLSLSLWSCNPSEQAQHAEEEDKKNCTRPIPEAVLDSSLCQEYSLSINGFEADEKASFSNGDRLWIAHKGCEYLELRYRFETSRELAINRPLAHFELASLLLHECEQYNRSPIKLKDAASALLSFQNESNSSGGEQWIDIENTILPTQVKVEPITQTKNGLGLELSLRIGPL